MLKLELVNSAMKGKQVSFKDGLTIGSGPAAKIRAQHPGLHPLHARFYLDDGRPMVEIGEDDAHILLNGRDVVRGELRHADEITIGPLRFRVIDLARASQVNRLDSLINDWEAHAGDEVYDFAKEDLFYLATKDHALRQAVSFSIPSKDKFIEQSQSFLARLVKGSGMSEEKVDAYMTCAKELILNAHRHGHKYLEDKRIVIRYRDLGDRVQTVITDEGSGFDHRAVIGTSTAKNAATAARERYMAGGFGGLGFQLITRLADELSYNDAGNQVTFVVRKQGGAG